MTIAAGFPYHGGILLCADTQHEGGATKSYSAKIGLFECPAGKVGYAYSGNTNFAVAAVQQCSYELKNVSQPKDIFAALERVAGKQYRKTVYGHPDRKTDWSVPYSLLFAIWQKDTRSWLCATHETTLRNVLDFECIGLGADLAYYLISPTYTHYLSENNAIYLASYMLNRVTKYVPSCGGPLNILVLRHNGTYEFLKPFKSAGIAESSEDFEIRSRRLFFGAADLDFPDHMFEFEIESFAKWMRSKRAEFRAANQPDPEPTTADPSPPQPSQD